MIRDKTNNEINTCASPPKLRFRLPLLISAAFATCQLIDNWVPRVDFVVEEEEDDGDGDDVSEDEDDEVEESGEEGGQLLDLDEDGNPLRTRQ